MESYTCQKCGKTMNSSNFFTYKNGEKTEMCKKCLTMHVDNYDENTYLWLLEKMDVPYIESINEMFAGIGGRIVNAHQILFDGLCPECQKK